MGCRMDRSQAWSTRIKLEASMHEESSFLTLTFNDENLPADGGVHVRDLQLFMKRLRKAIAPKKVRYYACGEYGDNFGRPHYHMVLFGFGFPDKTIWRKSPTGHELYRSALLESLWPYGNCEIGTVTAQSGAYVARYVLKKVGGAPADDHYTRPHPVTGEMHRVSPEFALMSSRPGIAGDWFDKFEGDVFPSDFLVIDARKVPVPKYFSEKLKGRNLDASRLREIDDLTPIRDIRRIESRTPQRVENRTKERLAIREEIQAARMKRLKRDVE
ncbi:MAG: replication associated protein [Microviridae sp.]